MTVDGKMAERRITVAHGWGGGEEGGWEEQVSSRPVGIEI